MYPYAWSLSHCHTQVASARLKLMILAAGSNGCVLTMEIGIVRLNISRVILSRELQITPAKC